jgi:hypothetical protein
MGSPYIRECVEKKPRPGMLHHLAVSDRITLPAHRGGSDRYLAVSDRITLPAHRGGSDRYLAVTGCVPSCPEE